MNSDEIKESLDEWLSEIAECNHSMEDIDVDSTLGKWKRISKKKDPNGSTHRIFLNTKLNKQVLVIDDEIKGFLVDGDYAFYLYTRPNDHFSDIFSCYVFINDLTYFRKHKVLNDWHLGWMIHMPDYLSEVCEAEFGSSKSLDETKKDLLQMGFVEDEKFSQFMSHHC